MFYPALMLLSFCREQIVNTRALISQALKITLTACDSEQSVPRLMVRVVGITSKDLLEEPNILEGIYNDKSSRR